MRLSRVYTSEKLQGRTFLQLSDDAHHYVSRVLRLKQGDPLVLFNGDGYDYRSELIRLDRRAAEIRINSRQAVENESPLHIHLVQSISRGERMDYTLRKAVELGVREITPVVSAHTVVHLKQERLQQRQQHWQSIIVSACEQSGRARLPELHAALPLDDWLSQASPGSRLVLDPAADCGLSGLELDGAAPVCLLVGPEGGFSEEEVTRAITHGCRSIRLGPRTLRTETAGPAAIALLQGRFGDMG